MEKNVHYRALSPISDLHVQNKKYWNFVSMSRLTGKCAAQKLSNFCSSSLSTCLHHMVILRNPPKITDFFMILAIYVSSKCEKTNHKKKNYNLMGRFFQTFFLIFRAGPKTHPLGEILSQENKLQLR